MILKVYIIVYVMVLSLVEYNLHVPVFFCYFFGIFFRWKCIAQIQTNPIFTEAIKVVRDLYNFCFKIAKKRVKD